MTTGSCQRGRDRCCDVAARLGDADLHLAALNELSMMELRRQRPHAQRGRGRSEKKGAHDLR